MSQRIMVGVAAGDKGEVARERHPQVCLSEIPPPPFLPRRQAAGVLAVRDCCEEVDTV